MSSHSEGAMRLLLLLAVAALALAQGQENPLPLMFSVNTREVLINDPASESGQNAVSDQELLQELRNYQLHNVEYSESSQDNAHVPYNYVVNNERAEYHVNNAGFDQNERAEYHVNNAGFDQNERAEYHVNNAGFDQNERAEYHVNNAGFDQNERAEYHVNNAGFDQNERAEYHVNNAGFDQNERAEYHVNNAGFDQNERAEYHVNNAGFDQNANSDYGLLQDMRNHHINVELSKYHSSNRTQQNYLELSSINESSDDGLNSEIAELDDTVERLCEKEMKKIFMIWNVIAKYLGLSSNSYSVTDTASVSRLYAIVQTFIQMSKKEDFKHMSIRNILEVILGHLKDSEERGNDHKILAVDETNPNGKIPRYSNLNNIPPVVYPNDNTDFKYILEVPRPSQHEEIDVIITGNKHSSSDAPEIIVVVPEDNGNNDSPTDSPVAVEPETSSPIINQFHVTDDPESLPPHVYYSTENPQTSTPVLDVFPVNHYNPDVPRVNQDMSHLIEHLPTDEEHMYPLPVGVVIKDNHDSLNRLQSNYSMSIWQQMLRLYGRCPESRSLLMQVKFLIDALDRQTC